MSYSTDPIKDAYRHTAKVDAETMALELITRHYASVINGVLTKSIRQMDHQVLSLPYTIGMGTELAQMPVGEAVEMEVSEPTVLAALMRALAESDCPHVEALRQAIADDFSETFAVLCARAAL